MSEEALTPLETAALNMALSVDFDWARALRKQIPMLRVTGREHTGVGLWVDLALNGECEPAEVPLDDPEYPPAIIIRHRHMPDLGSFIVFTKDGFINALEGVAHGDGIWPSVSRLQDFELFAQRDGVPPDKS